MVKADAQYGLLDVISRKIDDGRHECLICPHHCKIRDGQNGLCKVRQGSAKGVILSAYGQISNMAVEPIEKKPIFHFKPGMKTLSCSGWSCNLDCNFCQNFGISQNYKPVESVIVSPKDLIKTALDHDCEAICFTYNEPIIYFEYVLDVIKIAKEYGLKTILKTNAYAEREPWRILCKSVDAMNIDWKGTDQRYRETTGVEGLTSLSRLKEALNSNLHVEISVPVYHDSKTEEYDILCQAIKDFSLTPIHLLKLFPAYKTTYVSLTSDYLIKKIHDFMSLSFKYVYVSNVFGKDAKKYRNTVCAACKSLLIERTGLDIKVIESACCNKCPLAF